MFNIRPFVLLFLLLSCPTWAEMVEITQIDHFRDRGYDYLDVYTTGWSKAKGLLLEDKLYIDFPNTQPAKELIGPAKKTKRISRVEVVKKDESTTRLIIHLRKKIDYDIVNVFGRNKSVIEIGDRLDSISANQAAWEKTNLKGKGQPLKPVKLAPEMTADLSLKGRTIIVDPGHGGDDPGACSRARIPEKALTLQTAQKIAARLRQAGAAVYLTRNEDRRSDLRDVVAFANRVGADIFISIHYNSIYNRKISGTETYYYHPASRRFAEEMHEALVRGIRRRDRGLHRVPFYVVKNSQMPSVLLEPVYLTNSDEYDLASSANFQDDLAEQVVKGVKSYFRNRSR